MTDLIVLTDDIDYVVFDVVYYILTSNISLIHLRWRGWFMSDHFDLNNYIALILNNCITFDVSRCLKSSEKASFAFASLFMYSNIFSHRV